jgi:hypothetical protein
MTDRSDAITALVCHMTARNPEARRGRTARRRGPAGDIFLRRQTQLDEAIVQRGQLVRRALAEALLVEQTVALANPLVVDVFVIVAD